MNYKVKISISEAHEVLLGLSLYIRQTHLKYLNVGANWAKETQKKLTNETLNLIKDINDLTFFDLSVILIDECPYKTFEKYIEWLKELKPGDIYELLSKDIDNDSDINKNFSIPNNLSFQRDIYVRVLNSWYKDYHADLKVNLVEKIQYFKTLSTKLLNEKEPQDVVEYFTEGILVKTNSIKIIYLIPSYHFCPMSLVDTFGNKLFIMYPMNEKNNLSHNILLFGKTLGDKTRIEILKFLSTGIHTFTDIVKYMNMSKGTIHHHLLILRSSGFLNIYITDDKNNFHYSIKKNLLSDFEKEYLSYFIQDDE